MKPDPYSLRGTSTLTKKIITDRSFGARTSDITTSIMHAAWNQMSMGHLLASSRPCNQGRAPTIMPVRALGKSKFPNAFKVFDSIAVGNPNAELIIFDEFCDTASPHFNNPVRGCVILSDGSDTELDRYWRRRTKVDR